MRLASIKLAGFKSFVDPTTFHAPSNLTGIVGPNGCGKSNIIDAVRWVMGEGSAKVLRGESMADVIFSGSSTRKPVGTATVELIFDNSDGRVGGQFADYSEISVKRQVSRDGVSLYYLNGTRCRRKDVRDLFLGTGLGSRSYSIIEQGMISEVVEARPEEIRGHLEEAAGISRYKERRRETERRIQHTRDNLARLSDLREEVTKHLNRLKRQAAAAKRYRKLQQEKRELESRLVTLRWKKLMADAEAGQQDWPSGKPPCRRASPASAQPRRHWKNCTKSRGRPAKRSTKYRVNCTPWAARSRDWSRASSTPANCRSASGPSSRKPRALCRTWKSTWCWTGPRSRT